MYVSFRLDGQRHRLPKKRCLSLREGLIRSNIFLTPAEPIVRDQNYVPTPRKNWAKCGRTSVAEGASFGRQETLVESPERGG